MKIPNYLVNFCQKHCSDISIEILEKINEEIVKNNKQYAIIYRAISVELNENKEYDDELYFHVICCDRENLEEEIKKINNGNVPNKYFEILKIEIPKEKLKKYNFEYSGIDTDSDIVTDIDIPSKYIKRLNDNSINISKTTIPKITQKKTTVIPKMETVE